MSVDRGFFTLSSNPSTVIGTKGNTLRAIESHTGTQIRHHSKGDQHTFQILGNNLKTNGISVAQQIIRYLDTPQENFIGLPQLFWKHPVRQVEGTEEMSTEVGNLEILSSSRMLTL